ncbi:MAG TPA: twin-arginine translocase TatA/TatE family subunit [Actinomycetes bacterium]
MFNVGIGEILTILLVCLVVFGPERLPEIARQVGRALGKLRLASQGALDQLRQEANLQDLNLPDLRVGSLRSQARDYVRELMDVDGQMEELRRTAELANQNLTLPKDLPNGKDVPLTADLGVPPIDPDAT